MSRTISLFFPGAIKEVDFLQFVAEFDGSIWRETEPGALNVIFSDGECHVWIYGTRFQDAMDFEAPSAQVEARLNGRVKMRLDLVLSYHHDSALLGLRLAYQFLCRWSGIAEFPFYTALAQGDAVDALSQTSASDFFGPEVRVLSVERPKLNDLIGEFGGIIIDMSDPQVYASAIAALPKGLDFEHERDSIVGMISADMVDIWIMISSFNSAKTCGWDSMLPVVKRHLGRVPMSVVRVVIGNTIVEDMDPARLVAMSFAKRASCLADGVLVGLFYVVVGSEQIKNVLESGQWMHVS